MSIDKEKQIEEMNEDLTRAVEYDIENSDLIDTYATAIKLIKLGWIKPTEDSVVLSREEFEKLLKIKEEASVKETNYFSNLFKLQKELEQVEKERDSAIDNCDRKSKETAEKILNEVKKFLIEREYKDMIFTDVVKEFLNQLTKQFNVEIKE